MRLIAAYIAELRRDREYHRANEHTTVYTTQGSDTERIQGNRSGDGRCDQDGTGQSRDNV